MTYTEALTIQSQLEANCKALSKAGKAFPKGEFNLTPDSVKSTPEYQQWRNESAKAFKQLQTFNASFVKTFKAEIKANRKYK